MYRKKKKKKQKGGIKRRGFRPIAQIDQILLIIDPELRWKTV